MNLKILRPKWSWKRHYCCPNYIQFDGKCMELKIFSVEDKVYSIRQITAVLIAFIFFRNGLYLEKPRTNIIYKRQWANACRI